jgi:hypothetical protein
LVGQDFTGIREAAKKYGVNIKAANYLTNAFGVDKTGFNEFLESIPIIGSDPAKDYPQYKVPVKPGVLTFTPGGKVFESDGTQITEIKYRRKK